VQNNTKRKKMKHFFMGLLFLAFSVLLMIGATIFVILRPAYTLLMNKINKKPKKSQYHWIYNAASDFFEKQKIKNK
jgi:hypothetical protein